ncbi:unnamed protein product [Caenorhabditis angaria]|uniref:Uncharacterized protein n=1 Tax=Caenorhabditis angaria TaxID=860376 RepID=A0A9P1I2M5_9PELO|nr:unnamed protein product [Caenorhabditis angaria]
MAIIEEFVEGEEDILDKCENLKKEGNSKFAEGKYEEAEKIYKEAFELCPETSNELKAILLSNLAAAQIKLEKWQNAAESATNAIELGVKNEKALERRAFAYSNISEKYESAIEDYQKLAEICEKRRKNEFDRKIQDLNLKIGERNEALKKDVMEKLKGFGDFCLRPFGLSTDSFELKQNEQGGYSVQMKQQQQQSQEGESAAPNNSDVRQTRHRIQHKDTTHVYHLERNKKVYTFEFPDGVKIVDVQTKMDCSLGSHVNLKLAWTLGVPEVITVVKTLFTNEDMHRKRKALKLYRNFENWPHVVAIGAKNSCCFIGNLQQQEDFDPESLFINTVIIINVLSPSRSESRRTFTYTSEDFSKTYDVAVVSVTSLGFLPRSRTLLVGIDMGGIIKVALNPSSSIKSLPLQRPIRQIATVEPEDEPDRDEYFIAL